MKLDTAFYLIYGALVTPLMGLFRSHSAGIYWNGTDTGRNVTDFTETRLISGVRGCKNIAVR
jgi:hypothetical protein